MPLGAALALREEQTAFALASAERSIQNFDKEFVQFRSKCCELQAELDYASQRAAVRQHGYEEDLELQSFVHDELQLRAKALYGELAEAEGVGRESARAREAGPFRIHIRMGPVSPAVSASSASATGGHCTYPCDALLEEVNQARARAERMGELLEESRHEEIRYSGILRTVLEVGCLHWQEVQSQRVAFATDIRTGEMRSELAASRLDVMRLHSQVEKLEAMQHSSAKSDACFEHPRRDQADFEDRVTDVAEQRYADACEHVDEQEATCDPGKANRDVFVDAIDSLQEVRAKYENVCSGGAPTAPGMAEDCQASRQRRPAIVPQLSIPGIAATTGTAFQDVAPLPDADQSKHQFDGLQPMQPITDDNNWEQVKLLDEVAKDATRPSRTSVFSASAVSEPLSTVMTSPISELTLEGDPRDQRSLSFSTCNTVLSTQLAVGVDLSMEPELPSPTMQLCFSPPVVHLGIQHRFEAVAENGLARGDDSDSKIRSIGDGAGVPQRSTPFAMDDVPSFSPPPLQRTRPVLSSSLALPPLNVPLRTAVSTTVSSPSELVASEREAQSLGAKSHNIEVGKTIDRGKLLNIMKIARAKFDSG
eukprot:TRINITY_DN36425_c0_g1_i1.p1 TRINITY_DN36425_c0_g1~~TRINITY_DN36425_c0_g1_i1.p1  ORF type:complete len:673 (-),score=120.45 TRINITY_DN36425_c0_g1_i1:157-1938(-)